jgi:general secretion pathway protein A
MYESFFGLRERPFDLTPNPRYLVLTESHQEALSNLEYAIASRKGVTLLTGEAGSGKTTVIRAALEHQPRQVHCVHLNNPTMSRAEFTELLATRFHLSTHAQRSKAAMLDELEALLKERHARGETTVLVVDEAQSLPPELLEEVRLLSNIETDDHKLVSLIIAGQPELVELLNDPRLRQLKQRVALRCELRPLTLDESIAYVAGRIRAAGGAMADTITRSAVEFIHARALGIPRTISVIADNALLGAFGSGRRPVTTEIVRDVCRDFDFPADEADGPAERAAEPVMASAAAWPGGPRRPQPAPAGDRLDGDRAAPSGVPLRAGAPAAGSGSGQREIFGSFAARRKRFLFF